MLRMTRSMQYWIMGEGIERIRDWAGKGLDDKEIFSRMGICQATFYVWKKEFPIIASTIKEARKQYNFKLEKSLFNVACGENLNNEIKYKIADISMDFKSLTLLVLPEDLKKFESAIAQVSKYMSSEGDIFVSRLEDLQNLLKAQKVVQDAYKIENAATALSVILDVFNRHLDELSNGYTNERNELKHLNSVPMVSVFGDDSLPSDLAIDLRKAIKKAVRKDEISEGDKVEFLRILLEKYLAGD